MSGKISCCTQKMQKQILLAQQTNQTQQTQKTHVIAITSPDLVVQSPVEEEEEVIELPAEEAEDVQRKR